VGKSEITQVDVHRGDLARRASVHHIDLRALHLGKSVGKCRDIPDRQGYLRRLQQYQRKQ
jgi:hypothetical protein